MSDDSSGDARFLDEAVVRGVLDEAQAADCRRLLAALAEVEVTLAAADVAIRKGFLTKEQADELKRALARRRVGRYEVLERLGRGGTGVVWRARDVRLGRVVALKLLARPTRPDDLVTSYHARFQREARTAVTLNHVNIVRGLDYGESDGYVYFAMELVPGESAAERVRRVGRLGEAEALRIALQVVEALEYVREFELVHRDIKPENLLLTPNGEVKVCDLGLAKPTLEEASRLGGDGRIAGTPLYMAPEQVSDPDSVDWRTDVYGLGATLYHLLTGRPPFLPGPGRSVLQSHLHETPDDPREHVLEISAGAAAVVMKMLAKDAAARYASLESLASDLSAVVEGRPPSHALRLQSSQEGAVAGVIAETQGVRARLRQRRRRGLRMAAAASLAVAALAFAWSWQPRPREFPGTAPEVARGNASGEPTAPSPAQRQPAGPRAPAADPGRDALARARLLEREHAGLDDQIAQWRFVAKDYAAYPSGAEARERLAELEARLETDATEELERRRAAAASAMERDDVVAAVDELLAFPGIYAGTAAYTEAMNAATRTRREGREAADRWLDEARVAAVEWRFEDAARLVERARRTRLEGLPIRRVLLEIDLEQHARDAEHAQRRTRWELAAGRALMTAADDPAAAARLLDAEVQSGALRTYVDQVEALRGWLPRAHGARVRLSATWAAWAGEGRQLSFRTVGPGARDVQGVPAATADGRLALTQAGDSVIELAPEELPLDLLRAAIAPGDESPDGGSDDMPAFLLATRRLAEAAAAGAPPDLVDVVRAAAVVDATARLDRAAVLVAEGDGVGGRAAIDATIAYAPWYGPAYTALGRFLTDAGALDDAEVQLRHAFEAEVADPAARVYLAAVLERRLRYVDAEAHLRLFMDETADTTDDSLRALRVRAAADLERVRELRVQAVLETLRRDARNALRAGRTGEAAKLFESILATRPDDPEALLESGRLHRDAGRIFDAYRAWRRLVDGQPGDRRAAEAQRGIAGLERFRSGVPAGREALQEGRAALAGDRFDDAVSLFRRAIRLSPFLVDAHLGLAEALLVRGEKAEVRDDLTAAVGVVGDVLLLSPDLAAAVLVRARAQFALGELEAALKDAESAAQHVPDASEALVLAGRCLLGQGRLDEALTRFEEAFEAREYPDPLYWQAETLRRQGRVLQARFRLENLYDRWGAPPHLEVACARLYNDLQK